jgi:branched-chain amino acid transport system permease protein
VLPLFHTHLPSGFTTGIEELKPNLSVFILFVALLLLRTLDEAGEGSGRPGLVSRAVGHRPRVTRPKVVAGATLALVAVVAPFFLSRIRLDSAQRMLALTVVFISIVCITGFCGYITLGQAAFAGTGAYVSARVANAFGLPVIVAMLIGGLGAVVVGLIAGYPALKRRGLFLGLTTLAIGLLTYQFVFSSNVFAGGSGGLATHRPNLFGLSLDGERPFYWFELAWVGILLLLARNLRSGRLGRILAAMRDSETATRSIGIDLRRYKLFIFSVSAFIAGIGGALLAQQTRVFSPVNEFNPLTSLRWFLVVVVAGVGSLSGALVAGVGFIVVSLTVKTAGVSDLLFAFLALFIGWFPGGSLVGLARHVAGRATAPLEPAPGGPPALPAPGAVGALGAPVLGAAPEGEALVASPFARRILEGVGRETP